MGRGHWILEPIAAIQDFACQIGNAGKGTTDAYAGCATILLWIRNTMPWVRMVVFNAQGLTRMLFGRGLLF